MTPFTPDETAPLLIEITPTPGVQEVFLNSDELAAKADDGEPFAVKLVQEVGRARE